MIASDFSICPHNVPCARQPLTRIPAGTKQNLIFTSGDAQPLALADGDRRFFVIDTQQIAKRLDVLMRRCREEGHNVTYADLQALRGPQ